MAGKGDLYFSQHDVEQLARLIDIDISRSRVAFEKVAELMGFRPRYFQVEDRRDR
jgi:hypothetical protein